MIKETRVRFDWSGGITVKACTYRLGLLTNSILFYALSKELKLIKKLKRCLNVVGAFKM
jgi:hypothetical protein